MAESICGLKVFVGRFFPYQHIRGREKQKKFITEQHPSTQEGWQQMLWITKICLLSFLFYSTSYYDLLSISTFSLLKILPPYWAAWSPVITRYVIRPQW